MIVQNQQPQFFVQTTLLRRCSSLPPKDEHAAAVQRAMTDLLAGIPAEGTASPEDD